MQYQLKPGAYAPSNDLAFFDHGFDKSGGGLDKAHEEELLNLRIQPGRRRELLRSPVADKTTGSSPIWHRERREARILLEGMAREAQHRKAQAQSCAEPQETKRHDRPET